MVVTKIFAIRIRYSTKEETKRITKIRICLSIRKCTSVYCTLVHCRSKESDEIYLNRNYNDILCMKMMLTTQNQCIYISWRFICFFFDVQIWLFEPNFDFNTIQIFNVCFLDNSSPFLNFISKNCRHFKCFNQNKNRIFC